MVFIDNIIYGSNVVAAPRIESVTTIEHISARRRKMAANVTGQMVLFAVLATTHLVWTPNMAEQTLLSTPRKERALPSQTTSFYLYQDILDDFQSHCNVRDIYYSKGAEPLWIKQLVSHPWRTFDPEHAEIFVIPANFAAVSRNWCNKTAEEFVNSTSSTLLESKVFRRNEGRDHVILSTYYRSWNHISELPSFKNMIWLERHNGGNRRQSINARVRMKIMHSGPPPAVGHSDRPNFPNHTLFFAGQADRREAYKYRVAAVKYLVDIDGPSSRVKGGNNIMLATPCKDNEITGIRACLQNEMEGCCTSGRWTHQKFIEEMSNSQWNLHINGDDAGSARFLEAVSLGVPSIVISPNISQEYFSFPDIIPWENFTVIVSPQKFLQNPKKVMEDVLREYDDKRDEMAQLQAQYAREFQWSHPESRMVAPIKQGSS